MVCDVLGQALFKNINWFKKQHFFFYIFLNILAWTLKIIKKKEKEKRRRQIKGPKYLKNPKAYFFFFKKIVITVGYWIE